MELFGTAGIRGSAVDDVTPERALVVGRAAALHADEASFVLGVDGRETSPGLAAALASGLASGGADVERVGRVPTPALAFASRGRRGVAVTASHNPPTDNGIKLFRDGQEYDADAEAAVERRVAADPPPIAWDRWGTVADGEVLGAYREAVVSYLRAQFPDAVAALAGAGRVAVDCGNGVSALATPQVVRELGATPVAINANVDGHFPARESKPTEASLSALRRFVAAADDVALGVGHDGDGDRLAVVGPDGELVHEDTVLAVIAERYVRAADAADPVVVTTPNASSRIDQRVAAAGGRTERVALGALHEGVARERAGGGEDTAVVFAAEPWKHLHPAFGGWIDAVVSAALVAALAAEAGGTDALTAAVEERPYRKANVECPETAKGPAMERLREALPEALAPEAVDTEYGVRLELAGGAWVLVRPSGTEPCVRIYAEAEDVDDLVERVRAVVADAVASV